MATAVPLVSPISASDVTSTHPKLLASDAGFADIKSRISTDSTLNSWYPTLVYRANQMLSAPVLNYTVTSGRLLAVSESLVDRAYTLGFVWRMTGDSRYADRLWADLHAVSNFPDWNPSHFLDVAEMSQGYAIGYDWLYSYWTPAQLQEMSNGINAKSFAPALSQFSANASWVTTSTNWNLISNSGIGLAALAFSGALPGPTDAVLRDVSTSIGNGLSAYGPDGGYEEGISYWSYATGYLTTFTSALLSSTGKTYGILQAPGLSATGNFAVNLTGASGASFSYGDAYSNAPLTMPLLGLSRLYNDPSLVSRALTGSTGADQEEISARAMLWAVPQTAVTGQAAQSKPLDATFSNVGVTTMRSSWSDRNGTSIAMRASPNDSSSHANLDGGDFTLDSLGVNWATETGGTDQYDLPGYLDSKQTGQRWDYYRNRAEAQNTLVVNPNLSSGQSITANPSISISHSDSAGAAAIADLSGIYSGVSSWKRGISLFDSRQRVLVQDEVMSNTAVDAWWFMHTNADVAIASDGRSAVLTQNGQQLLARIASTDSSTFTYMSDAPLPVSPSPAGQQLPSTGKLAVHLTGNSSLTFAVDFTPLITGGATPALEPVVALSQWPTATSSSAQLASVTVDGGALSGFTPAVLAYSRGASSQDAPPVVAATAVAGATVTIAQASSVPGTATMTVSKSGLSTALYRIVFFVGAIPPVNVVATTAQSTVSNLVDGNIESQWNVNGDQSVVFDYGRSVTIKHVETFWPAIPTKGALFEIYGSNDNLTWATAFVGSNWVGNSTRTTFLNTPLKAYRYVKLAVHGDKQSSLNTVLSEFQAFSQNTVAENPPSSTPHATAAVGSTWNALNSGQSNTLGVTFAKSDGTNVSVSNDKISYQSADPSVAAIDSNGVVTGGIGGVTRVSASTVIAGDWVTATQPVTVTDPLAVSVAVGSDSYVIGGGSSANNYSSQNYMQVLSKPAYAAYEQNAFIGFSLNSVTASNVESARLVFTSWIDPADSTADLTAYAVNGAWSESTVTFNNQPAMEYRVGRTTIDSTEASRTMDVTDFIRQRSGSSISFGIRQDNPPGGFGPQIFIRGKGSAAPPRLEIRLRPAGAAPIPAPTVSTAYSTAANEGTISGSVSGAPSSIVAIDLGVSSRSQCPPVAFDAAALPTVLVQTDSSGVASFAATGTFPVGASIIATATSSGSRSVVSACKLVAQNPGAMSKVSVPVQSDSYVQGGSATSTNYGSLTYMQVLSKPDYPTYEQNAFLGFSLSGIDPARVQSATLVFNAWVGPASTTANIAGYAANGAWTESGITFANQPPMEFRVGTTGIDSTAQSRQMDVTDYVRQRAGQPATIAIRQDLPSGVIGPQIYVSSRESSTPAYIDVRLRPAGVAGVTPPSVTSAVSSPTNKGTVTGTVTGPANSSVIVSLGNSTRAQCPAVMIDATQLASVTVTTDSSGSASFSTTGTFAVGSWIIAAATAGTDRSAVSACVPVTQDPNATSTASIPVNADSFVMGGNGSASNFGSANYMQELSKPAYASFEQRAFVGFSLASLANADIVSATLVYNAWATTSGSSAILTSYAVNSAWSESTLTFNNQPPMDFRVGSTQVTSTEASTQTDVTDFVRSRLGTTASFGIREDNPPGGVGPSVLIRAQGSAAPAHLEIVIRAKNSVATAAPTISTAYSSASGAGSITGSVSGPPATDVVLNFVSSNRQQCAPSLFDGAALPATTVRTNSSGSASYSVAGNFAVGDFVLGTATVAGNRSAVSSCKQVAQDPTATAKTTVVTTADSFVVGGSSSDNNYGALSYMQVLSKPAYASYEQSSYVGFSLANVSAATVQSATLVFTSWVGPSDSTATLSAYAATGNWSENALTFNNQPTMTSVAGTVPIDSTEKSRQMDVTDFVRQMAGGYATLGFRQDAPPGGIGPQIFLRSRESSTPATLVILSK
ncbi:discoidin domain-containing protein [Subtercola vilae]|uniref:Discoidin domain-containing protein n=2 Tax=Subtercola vilae TaxID=2056433 RepID=A0A4T2BVN9_9MICO|nr:discoidin domain-containing protein [Subtercola vilae]